MKLQQLFADFSEVQQSLPALEISTICFDTRKVVEGAIFVAIQGEKLDGHDFLDEAVRKGAFALVVQKPVKPSLAFAGPVIQVKNTREALDRLASTFFWNPSRELFCAGVTGTNGKTSITYLVEALMNSGGLSTGVIGTINHHFKDQIWSTERTTPDPVELQSRLKDFLELGAKACVMEVTSHALEQKRVESVLFNCALFTNLTRDHLDYHKTMGAYFSAKERFFTELLAGSPKFPLWAIVNTDDAYGRQIRIEEPVQLLSYGQRGADFRFQVDEESFSGTRFTLFTPVGEFTYESPLVGLHNVYNAVASIAAAFVSGVPLEKTQVSLKNFSGIPGRLQHVSTFRGGVAFVDYAHTPDGLDKVLTFLYNLRNRQKRQSAKIYTVFGCGGDRDKGKRPLMAQIAQKYSDVVVVTSDNPRTEDPQSIVDEICTGLTSLSSVHKEVDRRKAIEWALSQAGPEDVVLVAGKGHEDYQIIGTQKINFSDVEVIRQFKGT